MKSSVGIFFQTLLLISILAGCSGEQGRRPRHLLALADSLCTSQPDSALHLLQQSADSLPLWGEADRQYYYLLQIKASDKAYIPHSTDTVINSLIAYYEHSGNSDLLPTVYYYAGRVYSDLNNAPQALHYFQKAITLMDDAKFLRQKELTYSQMGQLFRRQRLDSEAQKMYEQALECGKKMNDTLSMIYALRDIACLIDYKIQPDSAFIRFQRAYSLAKQSHNDVMAVSLETQLASFYAERKDFNTALYYIRKALAYDNPNEYRAVNIIAAEVYEALGQEDTAYTFYQKLLPLDDLLAQQWVHRALANYYVKHKSNEKAIEQMNLYHLYTDSLIKSTASDAVAQMNAAYNYQHKEKENVELKLANQKKTHYLYIILTTFVIAILLSIAIIERYKRKSIQYKSNLKQLEHLLAVQSNLKQAFIKEKDSTIKSSSIYLHFNQLVDKETHPSSTDWEELNLFVHQEYPSFKDQINDIVKVSEYEFRICLLIKLQLLPSQMAILTNHSKTSISSVRSRLYKKAFGKKGAASDWDKFIMSL